MSGSHQNHYDALIIGSGPAGQRAAIEMAWQGRKVAIVEKQELVGGVCLHTGTMPSKSLREAVLGLTGWRLRCLYPARVELPEQEVTMDRLRQHIDRVISKELAVIQRQMASHGVELLYGEARFIGPQAVEITSHHGRREITSESFLIATGTMARRPDWVPFNGRTVIDSDQVCTIGELPHRMVLLGGGVVALEYAAIFGLLGVEVHVIHRGAEVLPYVDPDMMAILVPHLEAQGVTFHLGVEATAIEPGGPGRPAVLTSEGEAIGGDLIIVALGRTGTAGRLDLERAGVRPSHGGLLEVNDHYQTSAPHIYAAGDVIGQPATASTARAEAERAALHLLGRLAPDGEPRLLPFGIYTIPEIAYVGPTEPELQAEGVPYFTGISRYREVAKGEIIGDEEGMLKLLFHRETGRLLGVHIIGTSATDLVQLGHAVITLEGTIDYFTGSVFNFPTLSECYAVAAHNARREGGQD